jgi:large-conductance mechanosensitive channel
MKRIGFLLVAIFLFLGVQANAAGVNIDSLKNELKEEVVKNSKELHELQKDSLMLSKLSPSQLLDLKRQEFEVEKQRIENEGRNDMPLNGFGIFMITLLPFLFIIVVLFIQARARNRESQRRYDIYMKSIEMGQSVPEHFFDEPKKSNAPSNLKKGILWLVIGLGIVISFLVMNEKDGLIVGIIPGFVGIGYLMVHKLDKPKTDSTVNNDEQHG